MPSSLKRKNGDWAVRAAQCLSVAVMAFVVLGNAVAVAEEGSHDSYPKLVTRKTREDADRLLQLERPGTVFFHDGFESPESLKKYFEIRGLREGHAKLTTSAELAHTGNGAIQLTAVARDGHESGVGAVGWFGPSGYDRVYFRRYIKFAADYNQGNLNHEVPF